MNTELSITGPHHRAHLLVAGTPIADAKGALVLVHGRGADAEGMIDLAQHFSDARFAWLAPQANGHIWYPYSFLTPIDRNQPHLDSALAALGAVTDGLTEEGITPDHQVLLGFSQGACLALEFAVRSDRRWGAVVGLSGGVIGPPGTTWDRPRGVAGTPVVLGCSDVDPHIPLERVHETRDLFTRLGAVVDTRIYPGMPHTINEDEIAAVRALLERVPR
ncbi:MAG: dienelactone hydrolase family protein [Gemmatimonadota bacterium]